MRIHRQSVLPIDAERAWALVLRSDTFLHVAHPVLGVRDPQQLPETWSAGATHHVRLTLFGVPAVKHRLTIAAIDHTARIMQTEERDITLPRWDHRLSVAPQPGGRCLYTDVIEVGRGPQAVVAKAFGTLFFAHRHRRLRRLASAQLPTNGRSGAPGTMDDGGPAPS